MSATILSLSGKRALAAQTPVNENGRLAAFLAKVYETMDDHYYLPVSKAVYDDFLKNYTAERLMGLNKKTRQAGDYVHLGAGLLVNKLKSPSDRFTNFVPSEKTKEFKSNAYAVTEDLGIEGKKTAAGFEITKVEKHCEAFEKGVRPGDILLKIKGRSVNDMTEEEIRKALSPELGLVASFQFFFQATKKTAEITLESKSYFKETVSVTDSGIPGILVIKISHFNQKTSEDFSEKMSSYGLPRIKHLVIDLRDNGGGPPLAAREILGFFLPPNDPLFAIARKKKKPVMLMAPSQDVSYRGSATVLVNKKTGSAAEMFSGILQAKKIAKLTGQKTAGATYLKSIYDFEDKSMIFMITSLTYLYDRRVYPPDGLTPDITVGGDEDSLRVTLDKLR